MTDQNRNKPKPIGGEAPADDANRLWEPEVKNADNAGLGALKLPGGGMGVVDEVNGLGATEVPGFVPTQHELLELVRCWARVAVDIDWYWFVAATFGSEDIRLEPFAWSRIVRIGELLGKAPVKTVVDEVYAEFGERFVDKTYWNIFLHGTEEERAAVRNELDQHPEKM